MPRRVARLVLGVTDETFGVALVGGGQDLGADRLDSVGVSVVDVMRGGSASLSLPLLCRLAVCVLWLVAGRRAVVLMLLRLPCRTPRALDPTRWVGAAVLPVGASPEASRRAGRGGRIW